MVAGGRVHRRLLYDKGRQRASKHDIGQGYPLSYTPIRVSLADIRARVSADDLLYGVADTGLHVGRSGTGRTTLQAGEDILL